MKNKFAGKKVAVVGYGLEGKDLVDFLLLQSSQVSILDQKRDLEIPDNIKSRVGLVTGSKYLDNLLKYDVIFRSPGAYRYKSEFKDAEKKGVEISSATKLFFDLCPAKIIGVTGTKGKGTTATLIYQILKKTGKDVYLAGNIGKPYLKLLPKLKKNSWVILEMSSFQLIDLHKSPHVAVVLNITSDHMDWHKSKKEYIDAKKNIVTHQTKSDFAVLNADYKVSRSFKELTRAKVKYFSKSKKVDGCYVKDSKIIVSIGEKQLVGDAQDLLLRGKHNWENVTAAICASYLCGTSLADIGKVVFSFKGLGHRLEFVGEINDVKFYNDSFATGPQPTIAAIKSFTEPITLILGGHDKGLDYSELGNVISKRKNVGTVILVGDIRSKIKKALLKYRYKRKVIDLRYSKMDKIVKTAWKNTPKGGVVLLSPAAASFDMFESYKDRGNQFKKAVVSWI